jgi:para-aminobenzoate synthetase component 2
MARILVIDNYDSFVFNLVQYLAQLGAECTVVRNDEVRADEAARYDGVLISPGPGTPDKAGVSIAMIKYCAENSIPLFGVKHLAPLFLAHQSFYMERPQKLFITQQEF